MRKIFFLFFFIFLSQISLAQTDIISQHVPNVERVGKYRFNYLFWQIYDASLYAPKGIYSPKGVFALRLDYLRWLKSELIAKRALDEIKQQGYGDSQKLSMWLDEMIEIFPNVEDGDSIIGIQDSQGHAIFYFNDKYIGKVEDRMFSKKFFGIWLNEKTSEPEMRKKLLGM